MRTPSTTATSLMPVSVLVASAGLLLAAAIPLGREALIDPVTIGIAVISLVLLFATKLDTLWIVLGAAVVSLCAAPFGEVFRLG